MIQIRPRVGDSNSNCQILGSALLACPACACGTPSCITISGPPHALVPGRPGMSTTHSPQITACSHAARSVRHNVRHQDTGTAHRSFRHTELQRIWYSRNLVVSRKFIQLMHRSPSLHASCTHPSSSTSSLCTLQRHVCVSRTRRSTCRADACACAHRVARDSGARQASPSKTIWTLCLACPYLVARRALS